MTVGPWVVGSLVEGRIGAIFAWVWMSDYDDYDDIVIISPVICAFR